MCATRSTYNAEFKKKRTRKKFHLRESGARNSSLALRLPQPQLRMFWHYDLPPLSVLPLTTRKTLCTAG